MRARVLTAMLAVCASGCGYFSYNSNYEADDRSGNQCRNECLAAADEVLLESCFKNCYHYHGGEFWPSASCAIRPPESIYKEPPKNQPPAEEFPAPAELKEPPAETTPAPAEPTPAPAETTPAPQPM
jgi:hypothetical protein